MSAIRPILGAALAVLLIAHAHAQNTTQTDSTMQMGNPTNDTPSTTAFKSAMMRMEHGMDTPYSGDADRDFVSGMIPHHEGAVAMAQVELKYGRDPALKKLARDIVAAQRREIVFMRRWQAEHAPK